VEGAGAELVGHSADARTAIADLSLLQPDLILVDIRLKSGSGFDVLQERHLLSGAVKAVLTNHANAEYEQLSFRLGRRPVFRQGFGDRARIAADRDAGCAEAT
jgi:DNA-binding NarL/FixJ family response regulator